MGGWPKDNPRAEEVYGGIKLHDLVNLVSLILVEDFEADGSPIGIAGRVFAHCVETPVAEPFFPHQKCLYPS